jgi:putative ABC transport system permease protein
MRLRTLVWKELRERPWALATSGLAILLGVASLVAIRHVTVASEREVSQQLATLGANILILPKEATLQDYYAADQNGGTLPEEHVSEVYLAGLTGVEKVSPKLSVPAELGGHSVTVTGILPQSEFRTKAAWQTVSLFSPKPHVGCKKAKCAPTAADASPEALATNRTIEELRETEAVIGADIADRTRIKSGKTVKLLGASFDVLAVLPRTGTVDDSRVFAHLHTVQRLAGSGEVVSAIEIMGCCEDAAGDLVPQLQKLLPDAKVITISQVVQTQVGVNRLMANTSWFVLVVLVIVGGASLAGAISANVRERRREIGTLMALGATPGFVSRLFMVKALVLGLIGGAAGSLIGLGLALWLGPHWASVEVVPLPHLMAAAACAACVLALAAAYWPARTAARLDPCICFREI